MRLRPTKRRLRPERRFFSRLGRASVWLEGRGRAPWIALGVFLFAAGIRLYFNLVVHPPSEFIESDMWVYDLRAKNLLAGTLGPWDSFTPRGYPALLAAVYALGGDALRNVAILQALLGGGMAALVFGLGRRLLRSNALALAAALLAAAHLPLVLYGGFLLSEIPFAFFLLLSLYLFLRGEGSGSWISWLGGCLAFAAASLVRPNLLPALPLVGLWAWWRLGWPGFRRALALGLLVGAAAGAVSWQNTRLVGARAGLATNGGLNFYLAFREVRGVAYDEGGFVHHIFPIPNLIRYREVERVPVPFYQESHFYREGLRQLREDPDLLAKIGFNLSEGAGLGRQDFWPGWEGRGRLLRAYGPAFFFALILPALAFLAWSLWRGAARGPSLLLGAYLASAAFTLAFFLGDPRMRVPFDPLLILLAVGAFDGLAGAFAGRRAGSALADADVGGDGAAGEDVAGAGAEDALDAHVEGHLELGGAGGAG